MQLVHVPQWVSTDGASPPCQKRRQQVRSAIHVHTQQRAYEAGGSEGAGRVIAPRPVSSGGQPTVCTHWTAGVLDAPWHVPRTPPGSESGACAHRGHSGTWENPWSPCAPPGMGDRTTTRPGEVWELSPRSRAREGHHERPEARKVSGGERHAKRPERDTRSSSRRIVPPTVGNRAPRDPHEGRRPPGITFTWTERRERR